MSKSGNLMVVPGLKEELVRLNNMLPSLKNKAAADILSTDSGAEQSEVKPKKSAKPVLSSAFASVARDYSLFERKFYRWTEAPEPNKYNLDRAGNLKATLAKLVMFKKVHDHPVLFPVKPAPKCVVGDL